LLLFFGQQIDAALGEDNLQKEEINSRALFSVSQ
jgi:hypothetical protein